ncbi:uncharacterized protein LOC135944375 [Cloeon dipterum]|uniref:uncharacterized protein LOC135938169 n=1 Tax=Cloeon dipterum TaxID=197152 RepID=UPI0032201634
MRKARTRIDLLKAVRYGVTFSPKNGLKVKVVDASCEGDFIRPRSPGDTLELVMFVGDFNEAMRKEREMCLQDCQLKFAEARKAYINQKASDLMQARKVLLKSAPRDDCEHSSRRARLLAVGPKVGKVECMAEGAGEVRESGECVSNVLNCILDF